MCYSRICEASHANFTIWESKLAKWMRPKQRRYHGKNTAVYLTYVYVPTYVPIYVPAYIAHLLPTPTYHPRNLELRNCLKVCWHESAMDLLTTRH